MVRKAKDGAVFFRNEARDGAEWCRIGTLKDGILEIWKSAANIFEKYNSAGFAKELIEELHFNKLRLCISDGRIFERSREFFIAHCFTVQEFGWDEQLHLRLSDFGMDKVDEWKKSQKRQSDKSPIRQMIEEQERKKQNRHMAHS